MTQKGAIQTMNSPLKEATPAEKTVNIEIKNETNIWIENNEIPLKDLSAVLEEKFKNTTHRSAVKVQIYSSGIIHSKFLDQLTPIIKAAGTTKIQVFTEEYIMPKNEVKEHIEITPETVILKANKMSFEKSSSQPSANPQEISTYTTLVKKYTSAPNSVSLENLKKIKQLYQKMTPKQRAAALPYPTLSPRLKHLATLENGSEEEILISENIVININKKGQLLANNHLVTLEELPVYLLKFNSDLSKKERASVALATIQSDIDTPKNITTEVVRIVKAYGVKNIATTTYSASKTIQQTATKKQLAEYNKIAKHYNTMSGNHMTIYKKDVDRLTQLYALMSTEQKAAAAAFPNFPEPPPAPKAPRVRQGEKSSIPAPPTPPNPITPLDHVIALAKKDALFYFEGKKISSDKAIELIKNNDELNLDIRESNKQPAVVKLSKDPIKH